jgi:hypothetical protein
MQMILSAIANLQTNPPRSSRPAVESAGRRVIPLVSRKAEQLPLDMFAPARDVLSRRPDPDDLDAATHAFRLAVHGAYSIGATGPRWVPVFGTLTWVIGTRAGLAAA